MKIKSKKIFLRTFIYVLLFSLISCNANVLTSIAASKDILELSNFSNFEQVSDSSNFSSIKDSNSIMFVLHQNSTLNLTTEMYRFELDQSYFDFNFSVGFQCQRSNDFAMTFKVNLESNHFENGSIDPENYNVICSTSLVSFFGEYKDMLYRTEYYSNSSIVKSQSPTFYAFYSVSYFCFTRVNGRIDLLIQRQFGDDIFDEFLTYYDTGVNRSLDSISIEMGLNSIQCNNFSIYVTKITGELYPFVHFETSNFTIQINTISSFTSISVLFSLILIHKLKRKKKCIH